MIDLDGAAAYGRCFDDPRSRPKSLKQLAYEILQVPQVRQRIDQLLEARRIRLEFEGDAVLRRFWQIATADPRELVEYRRTCCRHCYGVGHKYQMTQRELDERRDQFEKTLAQLKQRTPAGPKHLETPLPSFDELGGAGWDPRRDPNPECDECFGEGVERQVVKDTRRISPSAVALYAGVKTTKDGLQVQLHSQTDALVNVGKLLGQYIEKHEHKGTLTLEQLLAQSRAEGT